METFHVLTLLATVMEEIEMKRTHSFLKISSSGTAALMISPNFETANARQSGKPRKRS